MIELGDVSNYDHADWTPSAPKEKHPSPCPEPSQPRGQAPTALASPSPGYNAAQAKEDSLRDGSLENPFRALKTIQASPSPDNNAETQTEEAMNHTPYCNTGVKLAASTQGLEHRNQYDPPPIKSFDMEGIKLATPLNLTDIRPAPSAPWPPPCLAARQAPCPAQSRPRGKAPAVQASPSPYNNAGTQTKEAKNQKQAVEPTQPDKRGADVCMDMEDVKLLPTLTLLRYKNTSR